MYSVQYTHIYIYYVPGSTARLRVGVYIDVPAEVEGGGQYHHTTVIHPLSQLDIRIVSYPPTVPARYTDSELSTHCPS